MVEIRTTAVANRPLFKDRATNAPTPRSANGSSCMTKGRAISASPIQLQLICQGQSPLADD